MSEDPGDPDRGGAAPEPTPRPGVLRRAVETAGVAGAVHAGTGADADLCYLTGVRDPSSHVAVAIVADGAALFVDGPGEGATRTESFPGAVMPSAAETEPGRAAAEWLAAEREEGTVLAPRHVPHDTALYVESAGFDLASTEAVREARASKRESEIEAIQRTARAASHAMDRVRGMLADAGVTNGEIHWQGGPLSTERLRRQANAALASHGVEAAGNTRIEGGREGTASSPILRPDEPLVVSLEPRGPAGYHAALARTLVVDGSGGWERRAHVACEHAREVALDEATPGRAASAVGEELLAELGAYGFAPAGGSDRVGCGVGLSRREAPRFDTEAELEAGTVLRLAPQLTDEDGTRVALADTVLVGDDGAELLTTGPTTMAPN